jgi:hypothetical protein
MFGLIWYNNHSSKELNEISKEDQIDRAFEKYNYIVNSNLLRTSQQGDIDEEFDLVSLRAFSNFSKNEPGKELVRKQLTESTILVQIFDFKFNSIENITLYNKTPSEIEDWEQFRTLIPIKDPVSKKTYIGLILVKVYN